MTVAVVGAGLSGLLVAAELDRLGIETVVLEAADEVGGVTRTVDDSGYLLEPGGGSFVLPNPAIEHFLGRFGLRVAPATGARRRYLGLRDGLVELPSDPAAVITWPGLSAAGKARAVAEVAVTSVSPDGETVLGFMQRRFGPEAGRIAAHLAASGVFAGDPSRLSVAACFPRLVAMERSHGSVLRGAVEARRSRSGDLPPPRLHVPVSGMAAMLEQLAGALEGRVEAGFRVTGIEPSEDGWMITGPRRIEVAQVVAAVDPAGLESLVPEPLAAHLRGRPYAPVAVVGIGASEDSLPLPEGFGVLSHPRSGHVGLGALFESSYAPGRAPVGKALVKVIAGGATRPDVVGWDDEYLARVVGLELASMLGARIDAEWVHVSRPARGIPQYDVGHLRWLDRVEQALERFPGLHLTGWGYRGVGAGHVASDALRVASEIAAR